MIIHVHVLYVVSSVKRNSQLVYQLLLEQLLTAELSTTSLLGNFGCSSGSVWICGRNKNKLQ